MAETIGDGITLAERYVPIPASISTAAQQVLAMGSLAPLTDWPALDDAQGWRELVARQDEMVATILGDTLGTDGVTVTEARVAGIDVFIAVGDGANAQDPRAYVDVHGGAWAFQGGAVCRLLAMAVARSVDVPVWSVDYRQPPDHPWPDAVNDCLAVYRSLLTDRQSGEIVVGGTSAGGNIA